MAKRPSSSDVDPLAAGGKRRKADSPQAPWTPKSEKTGKRRKKKSAVDDVTEFHDGTTEVMLHVHGELQQPDKFDNYLQALVSKLFPGCKPLVTFNDHRDWTWLCYHLKFEELATISGTHVRDDVQMQPMTDYVTAVTVYKPVWRDEDTPTCRLILKRSGLPHETWTVCARTGKVLDWEHDWICGA